MRWQCENCDLIIESDPLAHDDWAGVEVAIGPDCEECGERMELVSERVFSHCNGCGKPIRTSEEDQMGMCENCAHDWQE